jgi:hypothetical protein
MREITVGEEKVTLDQSILDFGETNLNEFLQKVGGHHAYYAEKHADAMWIFGIYEQKHEEVYSKRFRELKGSGSSISVPLAEAAAKSDPDVVQAHLQMLAARRNKDLLNGFLKSIDKAFQAAMNYGYNKRKEMDKLNHDISGDSTCSPDDMVAAVLSQDS